MEYRPADSFGFPTADSIYCLRDLDAAKLLKEQSDHHQAWWPNISQDDKGDQHTWVQDEAILRVMRVRTLKIIKSSRRQDGQVRTTSSDQSTAEASQQKQSTSKSTDTLDTETTM
jgi:hypothetical protein